MRQEGGLPLAGEAPAAPAAAEAPKAAEAAAAVPGKFNEAPMLADLVKAGKLPPATERLPVNPGVMPTLEATGKYGGTVRRGFRGVSDRWAHQDSGSRVGLV
ncbi:MAG: hypothetical protein HC853_12890 [Anaerolineae bacterium]|nr:hypothetical protein [Anaerolineae bacterium]